MKTRPTAPRAFTLIELLTVIAIIGILAAIIIPVVGKVRATARTAHNASNLRQLALAANLYARENRDMYPRPGLSGLNNTYPAQIFPYVAQTVGNGGFPSQDTVFGPGLFQSPNRDFPMSGADIWKNGYSYGMTTFVGHTQWNYRAGAVREPSRTILFSDKVADIESNPGSGGDADYVGTSDGRYVAPWSAPTSGINNGIWASGKPAYRHKGGSAAQVSFVDGHVGMYSAAELELAPTSGGSLWQWWQ